MIIASCGSHHSGQVDNLVGISQLAERFNTWLHLEGHLISHLSLSDQPKKVKDPIFILLFLFLLLHVFKYT